MGSLPAREDVSQAWGRPGRILPTASRTIPIVGWGRGRCPTWSPRPCPRWQRPRPGRGRARRKPLAGAARGELLIWGKMVKEQLWGAGRGFLSFSSGLGLFGFWVFGCQMSSFSLWFGSPPCCFPLTAQRRSGRPKTEEKWGQERRELPIPCGTEPISTRHIPTWPRASSWGAPHNRRLSPSCPPAPRGTRAPGPTASLRWHAGTRWPRQGGLRSCRAVRRGNPKVFGVLLMDGSVRRGRGGGGGKRGPIHKQLEL